MELEHCLLAPRASPRYSLTFLFFRFLPSRLRKFCSRYTVNFCVFQVDLVTLAWERQTQSTHEQSPNICEATRSLSLLCRLAFPLGNCFGTITPPSFPFPTEDTDLPWEEEEVRRRHLNNHFSKSKFSAPSSILWTRTLTALKETCYNVFDVRFTSVSFNMCVCPPLMYLY